MFASNKKDIFEWCYTVDWSHVGKGLTKLPYKKCLSDAECSPCTSCSGTCSLNGEDS